MIARETICPPPASIPQPAFVPGMNPSVHRARPGLITDWHLGLLAIVYIRQSTPQQVLDHRGNRPNASTRCSTTRSALGWPGNRVRDHRR